MSAIIVSEARVPVAEDQIITDEMLTNTGLFVQGSVDNAIANFINAGVRYTGLQCAIATNPNGNVATLVSIQPGFFARGGIVYPLRDVATLDLSNVIALVPDSTKRAIVLILADGSESPLTGQIEELDEAQKPGDPNAYWPTKIVQGDVAIVRSMLPAKRWSDPALQPEAPAYPSTYCLIATAVVDNGSIVSITQETSTQITRLDQIAPDVAFLKGLVAGYRARIDGLQASQAAFAAQVLALIAALQATIAALQDRITTTQSQAGAQASGSTYSGVDLFVDESQSTPSAPNYSCLINQGLTFPSAFAAPTGLTLLNPAAANAVSSVSDDGSRVIKNVSSGETSLYDITADPRITMVPMTAFGQLSSPISRRGLPIQRTRYGSQYTIGSGQQLINSGDPNRIFAFSPTDLNYDPSWGPWQTPTTELLRRAGYWRDTASSDYWTRIVATDTIPNMFVLAQIENYPFPVMKDRVNCVMRFAGNVNVRIIRCRVTNGNPDLTQVLSDETNAYFNLSGPVSFPTPVTYVAPGTDVATLICTDQNVMVGIITANDTYYNPYMKKLLSSNNGQWYPNGNAILAQNLLAMAFPDTSAGAYQQVLLTFNERLNLAQGIDNLDLILPALIPPGCSIDVGLATGNAYQNIATTDPATIFGSRPNSLGISLTFRGTATASPILDLANVKATVSQQGMSFFHESATFTPSGPCTVFNERVIMSGFDPAVHTFGEKLETGSGLSTVTVPDATPTFTTNPDGTVTASSTWTLPSPASAFRLRRQGATNDAKRPYKVVQANRSAK